MPARLVFMGDRRVGTSSLIRRLTYGMYDDTYVPDVMKVSRHCVSVLHPRLTRAVPVQLWDVEGAAMRTAMSSARKAHAVVVLYDVTNRTSFEMAQTYLNRVNPRVSAMLIATKTDLEMARKVSREEGRLLAKIHRVDFVEVSTKLNQHVEVGFRLLLSRVPDEYLLGGSSGSSESLSADPPPAAGDYSGASSPVQQGSPVCTVCRTTLGPTKQSNSCHDLRHALYDPDDVFLRGATGERHRLTSSCAGRPRQYNRSMENLQLPVSPSRRHVHSLSS